VLLSFTSVSKKTLFLVLHLAIGRFVTVAVVGAGVDVAGVDVAGVDVAG
jgi:sulfite exporter TauE/SafE